MFFGKKKGGRSVNIGPIELKFFWGYLKTYCVTERNRVETPYKYSGTILYIYKYKVPMWIYFSSFKFLGKDSHPNSINRYAYFFDL